MAIVFVKQQQKLPLEFNRSPAPEKRVIEQEEFTKKDHEKLNKLLNDFYRDFNPDDVTNIDEYFVGTLHNIRQEFDWHKGKYKDSPLDKYPFTLVDTLFSNRNYEGPFKEYMDDKYKFIDTTHQSTLPQHMLGLYTENFLDPETGKVREGAIPPVNALKVVGRSYLPEIMTRHGLLPTRSYDNLDYERGSAMAAGMPFGSAKQIQLDEAGNKPMDLQGMTGGFVIPANMVDLSRVILGNPEEARRGGAGLIGIRGFGAPSSDEIQLRPPSGNPMERVAEGMHMNRIPPERLVPVRAPLSEKREYTLTNPEGYFGNAKDIPKLRGYYGKDTSGYNPENRYKFEDIPISMFPEQFAGMYDEEGFPMIDGKKVDDVTRYNFSRYNPYEQFNPLSNELYLQTTPPSWGTVLENLKNLNQEDLEGIRDNLSAGQSKAELYGSIK